MVRRGISGSWRADREAGQHRRSGPVLRHWRSAQRQHAAALGRALGARFRSRRALATTAFLGLLGLSAPVAVISQSALAGSGQKIDHFNVGKAHSPRLLNMFVSMSSGSTTQNAALVGALQGVDVASYQEQQPGGIDWSSVQGAGKQFTAIKATEGDYYTNPYALTDLANAKAAGLSVMAYAFAIPNGGGSSANPATQADDLINYLKQGSIGVPALMLDIEYDPYVSQDKTNECYGLSQSAMVTWISQFNAEVQRRTGQQPIIYTAPGWWKTCTGSSGAFAQLPLWEPYDSSTATSPSLAPGWSNWAFWQYSSAGTVSGISGNVDLDQVNPNLLPLLDPGHQSYLVGSPVGRQVEPADPVAGQTPSYTATGLPRITSVSSAGQITGWPVRPGTYSSTVTGSAGSISGSVSFPWTVKVPPDRGPTGPVHLALGGKCLDDVGNRSANGTEAEIWNCNGGSAQKWTYVQDGTLRIHRKCLTAPTRNGWKVRLESCTDATRQQWRLVYPRALNSSANAQPIGLYNRHSHTCLDDPGWSTTNGTRVVIRTCDGKKDQSWALPAGPIASQIPGKCVEDYQYGYVNGTKIDITRCNGRLARQTWAVESDGTLRVHGRCLNATGSAPASPVDLHWCTGAGTQQWRLIPAGAELMLQNPQSGLCLADPSDTTTNGTQLQIGTCTASDPGMVWRFS